MSAPTHVRTAPPVEQVTIYHVDTGAVLSRWPVDARGMIASGEYHWAPPGEEVLPPLWARGITPTNRRADSTADTPLASALAAPVGDAPVPPAGPKLTPLGEPVLATHSSHAAPAVPYAHPTGYTGTGKGRRGRA